MMKIQISEQRREYPQTKPPVPGEPVQSTEPIMTWVVTHELTLPDAATLSVAMAALAETIGPAKNSNYRQ